MSDGSRGEIVIYQTGNGQAVIEVKLFDETLWLTEQQIAAVFERDRTVIGRHIKKVFTEGELDDKSNVQKMHIAHSDKPVAFYSLDVIISVGYRVNSKRGTQFRIWANKVLKDHLVKGYSLNEKLLKEQSVELNALKSGIALLERSVLGRAETLGEAKDLVAVIADFSRGLKILDDYDHRNLDAQGLTKQPAVFIGYEEFQRIIQEMKTRFDSELFGAEKDGSFMSSVGQIYQSFDGKELYPTIEEKAAMLLYLVVKNHSFIDGNKRIAAALFLYFLDKNALLYQTGGETVISNEGLAALTLMIAESNPDEMETVKRVIVSILNRGQNLHA